jgi:hypothetical protein
MRSPLVVFACYGLCFHQRCVAALHYTVRMIEGSKREASQEYVPGLSPVPRVV